MGEKTTIEIENMRELKQHALDTSKTLKQIINEAIVEKINREREEMNLPPIQDLSGAKERASKDIPSSENKERETDSFMSEVDPQVMDVLKKFLVAHRLDWDTLTKEQWNEKIEYDLMMSLENIYDEALAQKIIELVRKKIKK